MILQLPGELHMNKTEFVAALAQHGAMTKTDAEKWFQIFRHTLETELVTAGKMVFPGFLTFEVIKKTARKGRNPATGQEIDIPVRKSIMFKTRKVFADKVNSYRTTLWKARKHGNGVQ